MPSPRSPQVAQALLAALLVAATGVACGLESAPPSDPAAQPTVSQIEEALESVRKDPNMGTERKARTLKWKSAKQQPVGDRPSWLLWIQEFFAWIARSARMIVWVLAATLAAFIAIYVIRLLRSRVAAARQDSFTAPSHVRDLDIRPESLPADIGAAALQLWESGEQRRALALLYRGLLSRMVHAHRAPVRDSTTEGECITLARRWLPATSGEFAAALVTTWQRAVYGGFLPATEHVRALCAGFSPSLDAADAGAVAP
jgi:hypothetical protein